MHTQFADVGVGEALLRLEAQLRTAHPTVAARWLDGIPPWVAATEDRAPLASTAAVVDARHAMDLAHCLRAARHELETDDAAGALAHSSSPLVATPTMHARLLAALVRLEYGDLLEAFAARAASAIAAPTESVVASDYAHARIARLHSDAYLAAVWTSAHAQFVAAAADCIVAERESAACLARAVGGGPGAASASAEADRDLAEAVAESEAMLAALPGPELTRCRARPTSPT